MVELLLPKQTARVRFPSSAPSREPPLSWGFLCFTTVARSAGASLPSAPREPGARSARRGYGGLQLATVQPRSATPSTYAGPLTCAAPVHAHRRPALLEWTTQPAQAKQPAQASPVPLPFCSGAGYASSRPGPRAGGRNRMPSAAITSPAPAGPGGPGGPGVRECESRPRARTNLCTMHNPERELRHIKRCPCRRS